MNDIAERLASKLLDSLPGSKVYWEKEPSEIGLDGAILSAEYRHKKFTVQFERSADSGAPAELLDDAFLEQVVDDFTDFFARTIYPKEKFTRII